MKRIAQLITCLLAVSAFAVVSSDAQTRRPSTRESETSRRSSSTAAPNGTRVPSGKSSATRPSTTRPTTGRPSGGQGHSTTRPDTKPSVDNGNKPGSAVRTDGNYGKPGGVQRPGNGLGHGDVQRPGNNGSRPGNNGYRPGGNGTRPSDVQRPGNARPDNNGHRPGDNGYRPGSSNGRTDAGAHKPGNNGYRPDNNGHRVDGNGHGNNGRPGNRPSHGPVPGKPVHQVHPGAGPGHGPSHPPVHPHNRPYIRYDYPSHFWANGAHCYGHRVKTLPSRVVRYYYMGHVYYCYENIWYRPYGGCYVVCRPPFGTALATAVINDMAWTAVTVSYYNTVARSYSAINSNNDEIARQNEIIARNNETIARNNATIAAQNSQIASSSTRAVRAAEKADELGLVQNYADAGQSYWYQDGVFYTKDAAGEYKVIAPPAGALVETLPEDYEIVTLKGVEYYKVDDTVYKVTLNDGKPYFEVMGQLL